MSHRMLSLRPACRIDGAALASLECQGRYITRPALAMNALRKLEDGPLSLETPPEPRTGASTITLDPLEWIHRLTAQVPDPGRNLISISIQEGNGKWLREGQRKGEGVGSRRHVAGSDPAIEGQKAWAMRRLI